MPRLIINFTTTRQNFFILLTVVSNFTRCFGFLKIPSDFISTVHESKSSPCRRTVGGESRAYMYHRRTHSFLQYLYSLIHFRFKELRERTASTRREMRGLLRYGREGANASDDAPDRDQNQGQDVKVIEHLIIRKSSLCSIPYAHNEGI